MFKLPPINFWSNFEAVSDVKMNNNNIKNAKSIELGNKTVDSALVDDVTQLKNDVSDLKALLSDVVAQLTTINNLLKTYN